ncbi:MAG: hypothetical protein AB1722_02205 [Pseudomonadota bacterium]
MSAKDDTHIPLEQRRYATLLNWGGRSGLGILIVSFIAYVMGWMPAHVPLEELPEVWSLPVDEYLERTNSPTGWGWVEFLREGDFAGLFGIAWLSGCTVVCLLAVMPIYHKRREYVFVAICAIALLVQVLAASGLLEAGH